MIPQSTKQTSAIVIIYFRAVLTKSLRITVQDHSEHKPHAVDFGSR